jgi:hypothetical protein
MEIYIRQIPSIFVQKKRVFGKYGTGNIFKKTKQRQVVEVGISSIRRPVRLPTAAAY